MNLQNFTVVRNGSVNLNQAPRYTITGQLQDTDPATGRPRIVADFTGANAITFPGELANRTAEEREAILLVISRMLIDMKAGVWTP